ncbi:MAG TPA: dephospho-CoA kinase [Candidatus Limnocylindrales bacterium]|nr:dephospho-CoA kinase [Candidatus Limnocylindrales bacterium]
MNRQAGSSRRTIRIGLTGPIGCGKSTVASWLAELGAVVVDADVVARDVVDRETPELDAVVREFGGGMLLPTGDLDRPRLGRLVFADPEALARLEAILHPAVRPRILAAMTEAEAAGAPAVVVEAIKLVEGGLAALCDEVWLVACDGDEQRARLNGRGMAPAQAEQRIAAQADLVFRVRPVATRVIDTSGSIDTAQASVLEAWTAALDGRVDAPESAS